MKSITKSCLIAVIVLVLMLVCSFSLAFNNFKSGGLGTIDKTKIAPVNEIFHSNIGE